MFKKAVKGISLAIGVSLMLSSFAACTPKAPETKVPDQKTTEGTKPADFKYPLNGAPKLKYWMELHANALTVVNNWGDSEFAKELAKRTGVQVEFVHPATGQAKEGLNLMIASGELPDIIEYKWPDVFPGGPNAAMGNGTIIKLNDVMEKYAPNFKKVLKSNPEMDKAAKTDEGSYFAFNFMRGTSMKDNPLINTSGTILRKDWLDELGKKVPETIDEWYDVLKAIKGKSGIDAAVVTKTDNSTVATNGDLSKMFAPGFDNWGDFYVDNGKVKYGPMDPERKKYIETMRKWYEEGLIDKNYATNDQKAQEASFLNGKSGVTRGSGGSGIGNWMAAKKDPKMDLAAAPPPTTKKGSPAKFSFMSTALSSDGNAAITTTCAKDEKKVEAAARMLDYLYSEEGNRFVNFGTEGTTYKMEGSKPIYTDLILNNPEKLAMTSVLSKHARGHMNGPFVQDAGYLEQYYKLPAQKEAMKVWAKHDMNKYMMPLVSATPDESTQLARVMNDINTYVSETETKIIMGKQDISTWDAHIEKIKGLGIDKAIKIKQDALERYNKR